MYRILLLLFVISIYNTPMHSSNLITEVVHGKDKEAQFPGGKEKMNSWIQENLRMPTENLRYGIVRVEFTVKKNGKCTDFEIVKSINDEMDFSATECLSGMPDWEPAVQHGKKVNSKVTIPVKFTAK